MILSFMEASSGARLCQTYDLLHEVFGYLHPPSADPGESLTDEAEASKKELRSSLFSAAQASRALSEHALNVLWKRLDTLIPLLCLLPSFRPFFPKPGTGVSHILLECSWKPLERC